MSLGTLPPPRVRHPLYALCGWLALCVPLALTLWRASALPQWRDDLAVVRGLGLVPIGGEGVLSSVMMQVAALLPFGGRLLRVALVSAVGIAIAARVLYALTTRLLDENAWTPRLGPPLALCAALIATLTPTWQLEATIAGGATIAAALVLLGVWLRPDPSTADARVWFGFGAFIALTTLESHAAGAVLAVALAVQIAVLGEFPPRRHVVLLVAGGALMAALCLVPLLVRPWAARAWVHLGFGLSAADVLPVDATAERPGALAIWLREVGLIAIASAAVGAAWGAARSRTRWVAAPLLAVVLADLLFPASRTGVLAPDALVSLRLLAMAAFAALAALGVQTAAIALKHAKIPFAQPAAALLVVFQVILVLMTAEDSSYVADRRAQTATETWTDESLAALPPRSLLLVRSEAVAWRLWASRVVRGERPDLVVVPLPLLAKGSVAKSLIAQEPSLAALIRDVSIAGRPSEYALSTLADARPLYVELDPAWDRRLVDHIVPAPLWLGFAPHARGRSDRRAGVAKGRAAFERVLAVAQSPEYRDEATLSVLHAGARQQAFALASLGDREALDDLLYDLRRIDPEHPFVRDLEGRLAKKKRGAVEVAGLLQ